MTVDLYQIGYHDQLSIDFSPNAIEAMKEKHSDLGLDWSVMDVRKMEIGDSTFDVAIDKVSLCLTQLFHAQCEKGTLDAMLHGSLWDPEDDVKINVGAYVNEVRALQ